MTTPPSRRHSMLFLATLILISPALASETTTGGAFRALAWQVTRGGPVTRLWVLPAAKAEAAKKWQTGIPVVPWVKQLPRAAIARHVIHGSAGCRSRPAREMSTAGSR